MQEFLVLLIVVAAALIVWKHMAPRSFRLFLNHVGIQIAIKMGWHDVTKRLAEKGRMMTDKSACTTCEGCNPKQQTGCEMFIRPENIQRK